MAIIKIKFWPRLKMKFKITLTFPYSKVQLSKYSEHKNCDFFLSINLNMCFGCSKEPSHWDGSFEYPQHMLWIRNKENSFPTRTLIWRPMKTKLILSFPDSKASLANILSIKIVIFLIHQLKHMFWVLKRTISLRRFF